MKIKNLILVFAVITLAVSSCKKEAGPAGKDGNANVKSITFLNPITNSTGWSDTLPGVTYQSLSNSLVLVYIQDQGCTPNWYSVPGLGCNASYTARFYTSYSGISDTVTTLGNLALLNPDGSFGASNQTISKLRVIVAPASTYVTGGKKEVDYSDYKATCRYFNIAE